MALWEKKELRVIMVIITLDVDILTVLKQTDNKLSLYCF